MSYIEAVNIYQHIDIKESSYLMKVNHNYVRYLYKNSQKYFKYNTSST